MTQAETHTFCNTFKDIIEGELVWFDGHFQNLVLLDESGEAAKVLDQDFFWRWGENFLEGPSGTQGGILQDLYEFEHPYFHLRMQSMGGHYTPIEVKRLIREGTHAYPDAEFFMYKMMERWGYVNYVRGQGWTDGAMKLEHVLEVFPNFEDARFVDPDLGRLLREEGVLPPRAPGGGGRAPLYEDEPFGLVAPLSCRRAA